MPDVIEPSGERGYPPDVEARLRVLEEIAAATKDAFADGRAEQRLLRGEFAAMRAEMAAGFTALRGELGARLATLDAQIAAVDQRRERDFRILFGAITTTTLGLAWLIARSAHWL